jgi:hypothetical protein
MELPLHPPEPEIDMDDEGEGSKAQAQPARARHRTWPRQQSLPGDGLLAPAVLRDPPELPDVRRRRAARPGRQRPRAASQLGRRRDRAGILDHALAHVAGRIAIPTSCSSSSRTSPTRPRGSAGPSRTASSSACIVPCSTSTSGSRAGPPGSRPSGRCRRFSMSPRGLQLHPAHQGRGMAGCTPAQAVTEGLPPDKEDHAKTPNPKKAAWPNARSGPCQPITSLYMDENL